MPLDEVRRAGRRGARLRRPAASSSTASRRSCRAASGGAWRSPARWPPSRGSCSTTRRRPASIRSRRLPWTRRSSSCATSKSVSSIVVTHQLRDAFFVATHEARRATATPSSCSRPTTRKADEAEFIMLKEGLVAFEGNAAELRASTDPYIRRSCPRGLRAMPRTRSLAWAELKIGLVSMFALVMAALLIFLLSGEGGFFWQRYAHQDGLRQRRRPEGRRAGPRGRRRGRLGDGRAVRRRPRRGADGSRQGRCRRASPRRRWRRSGRCRCSARRPWTSRRRASGTPVPEWGYVRVGPVGRVADRRGRRRRRRASSS